MPVFFECPDIAGGDSAVEVGIDVLKILGLAGVDVAGEVEVEVVLGIGDFIVRDESREAVVFFLVGEDINDLVKITFAEAVLVAVLHEALAAVDHEDALAGGGVFLIEDEDAGGDAGAVEEVGREADDALEVAGADELLTDDGLGIAPEEDAVRENAGAFALALHGTDDVEQKRVVTLLGRRDAPSEALVGVGLGCQAGAPCFN